MKHIGKMKNNSARVVVAYRTLPGDPLSALVIGTQGLIDSYHDTLMTLVETVQAQEANELADLLSVRKFPDGSNMLGYLHNRGHLIKVPTSMVLMTPTTQVSVPLDQLNELIAQQTGTTIDKLAIIDDTLPVTKAGEESKPGSKKEQKKDEPPKELTASQMREKADALYKQAAILRKQAELIEPRVRKNASAKALAAAAEALARSSSNQEAE